MSRPKRHDYPEGYDRRKVPETYRIAPEWDAWVRGTGPVRGLTLPGPFPPCELPGTTPSMGATVSKTTSMSNYDVAMYGE